MKNHNLNLPLLKSIQTDYSIPGISIALAKTGLSKGVRVYGGLLGGSYFSPNPMTAALLRLMFERGTKKRKKEEIYTIFDKVGASFSFHSNQFYLDFSLYCLTENVENLLLLISDMLKAPAFNEKEFASAKKQLIAELKQEKLNTQAQANLALCKLLYDKSNPNYSYGTDERIKFVEKLKLQEIKKLHAQIGRGSLSIVVVGDFESKKIISVIKKGFEGMKLSKFKVAENNSVKKRGNGKVKIVIPDKQNVDLFMGVTVPLAGKDEGYRSLDIATMILGGGGFTGRLMQEVRVKRGLTYGIASFLRNIDYAIPGHFAIWGTFSPLLIEDGKKAINEVVKEFYTEGVTEEEVNKKKRMLIGGLVVKAETSEGLGKILLSILKEGRTPEKALKEDIEKIMKTTVKEVNESIKCYLNPQKLTLVEAGTFK